MCISFVIITRCKCIFWGNDHCHNVCRLNLTSKLCWCNHSVPHCPTNIAHSLCCYLLHHPYSGHQSHSTHEVTSPLMTSPLPHSCHYTSSNSSLLQYYVRSHLMSRSLSLFPSLPLSLSVQSFINVVDTSCSYMWHIISEKHLVVFCSVKRFRFQDRSANQTVSLL